MTDPTSTSSFTTATDIVDDNDFRTAELDRQADAILSDAEARSFEPTTSVRQSIKRDAAQSREWARDKALQAREAVQDEPVKASLYALGLGLVIGLLIAR